VERLVELPPLVVAIDAPPRKRARWSARVLLVVTDDGYGKRIALKLIGRKLRDTKGVAVSSMPVAFSAVVEVSDALVLMTAQGKVQRLSVADIPVRTRTTRRGGGQSKGPG
jgi:hypothetical protein